MVSIILSFIFTLIFLSLYFFFNILSLLLIILVISSLVNSLKNITESILLINGIEKLSLSLDIVLMFLLNPILLSSYPILEVIIIIVLLKYIYSLCEFFILLSSNILKNRL